MLVQPRFKVGHADLKVGYLLLKALILRDERDKREERQEGNANRDRGDGPILGRNSQWR